MIGLDLYFVVNLRRWEISFARRVGDRHSWTVCRARSDGAFASGESYSLWRAWWAARRAKPEPQIAPFGNVVAFRRRGASSRPAPPGGAA